MNDAPWWIGMVVLVLFAIYGIVTFFGWTPPVRGVVEWGTGRCVSACGEGGSAGRDRHTLPTGWRVN